MNKSIIKRTIIMAIISFISILLNFWFFNSDIFNSYKRLVPEPNLWLWDILPLVAVNVTAGLIMGKTKKHKLFYSIAGSILSVFLVYTYVVVSFFYTMKDFN